MRLQVLRTHSDRVGTFDIFRRALQQYGLASSSVDTYEQQPYGRGWSKNIITGTLHDRPVFIANKSLVPTGTGGRMHMLV
jgi:hypothetical protein